jgi:ankyrin repeat protein
MFGQFSDLLGLAQTLHYAIRNNQLSNVQNVVQFSQPNILDERDAEGRTAVQLACAYGHVSIVRFLVESRHANLQATGPQGRTALHLACCTGNLELVVYLIETGRVIVDAPDSLGVTSLHCCCDLGHLSLVQYLVKVGRANVEASDFNGWTALLYACRSGNLELITFLFQSGVNVEATDTNGWTALHLATEASKLDVVRRLIDVGHANVEAATANGGCTAVHIACDKMYLPILQCVMQTGRADVETQNSSGETALHYAGERGRLDMVRYLVETCHANVRAVTKSGETTLDFAKAEGHTSVVAYLQQQIDSTKNSESLVPQQATILTQTSSPVEPSRNSSSSNGGSSSAPSTSSGSKGAAETSPLVEDRNRMEAAVDGNLPTFAVSEGYVQSILTDKELGRGFFGTVYRGIDRELGYSFAIKSINTEILTGGTVDEIQRTKQTFEKEQQVRFLKIFVRWFLCAAYCCMRSQTFYTTDTHSLTVAIFNRRR